MFKIRNKKTGEFSSGGMSPVWTFPGKSWSRIGHLKSHITQLKKYGYNSTKNIYQSDCEIVFYEVVEMKTEDII